MPSKASGAGKAEVSVEDAVAGLFKATLVVPHGLGVGVGVGLTVGEGVGVGVTVGVGVGVGVIVAMIYSLTNHPPYLVGRQAVMV